MQGLLGTQGPDRGIGCIRGLLYGECRASVVVLHQGVYG